MPKKTETLPVQGFGNADAIALCYGAFERLGWVPKLAGENVLVGYTRITWAKPYEILTVEAVEGSLTVTSAMPDNVVYDPLNKNKKNIAKLSDALQAVRPTATPEKLEAWRTKIEDLRTETVKVAEQTAKDFAEVNKVMNLSGGSKIVTYVLIGLNVAVFVLMAVGGVNVFEPKNLDLVRWGANYQPYTTSGEWWRLLTCIFVHIGPLHLVFNLYALFAIGVHLEPMLGKGRYIFAYLLTGVLASVTSMAWHGDEAISAGASGAIFGLYGVFLALLLTKLIPKAARQALLQSIGVFVVYNLAMGMRGGVDNAAHLGGLLSGFVLGFALYPLLKRRLQTQTALADSGAIQTVGQP